MFWLYINTKIMAFIRLLTMGLALIAFFCTISTGRVWFISYCQIVDYIYDECILRFSAFWYSLCFFFTFLIFLPYTFCASDFPEMARLVSFKFLWIIPRYLKIVPLLKFLNIYFRSVVIVFYDFKSKFCLRLFPKTSIDRNL